MEDGGSKILFPENGSLPCGILIDPMVTLKEIAYRQPEILPLP